MVFCHQLLEIAQRGGGRIRSGGGGGCCRCRAGRRKGHGAQGAAGPGAPQRRRRRSCQRDPGGRRRRGADDGRGQRWRRRRPRQGGDVITCGQRRSTAGTSTGRVRNVLAACGLFLFQHRVAARPPLSVPGHVDAVFRANAEHFRCVHFSTDAANVCEVRWRPRSRRSGRSISLEGIWASAVQRSVEP